MTRKIIALIGLALLVGCSGGGGGGDSSTTSSAPSPPPSTPTAQPDMLTATNQGLLRGKANGQGQQLVFSRPNLHEQFNLLVSDGNVVYTRTKPQFDDDIWTVRTDGTGDRALLDTPDGESPVAFVGPWVVFQNGFEKRSIRLDTRAQFLLHGGPYSRFTPWNADRLILNTEQELLSLTFSGTDPITHARLSEDDFGQDIVLANPLIVGDALLYRHDRLNGGDPFLFSIYAVPLAGGTPVQFESPQEYTYVAGFIDSRVVYHRCVLDALAGIVGPCDVVSAQNNGTGKVVLASHPANEAVQGVTTDQVIIRRNLSGNDQLLAVPVVGGAERLLMTMTDNEFVDLIVGDLIIVRRPSGTWSLDLNGKLTKLGTVAGDSGFIAVGNAVCLNKGTAVWCMPLDGTGEAVKIADTGTVVGVL